MHMMNEDDSSITNKIWKNIFNLLSHFTISSTLSCDFQPLTIISNDLSVISGVFVKLSQKKIIVEAVESIMGAHGEQSSPS